jgi:hypothetical protein
MKVTSKFTLAVVGVLLALLTLARPALAAGGPDHDAYVKEGEQDTNYDLDDLAVSGSTSACNPTDTSYLGWDLSSVGSDAVVDTVVLTLTTHYASNADSATLGLYETGDAWDETTLTAANAPALGALIETRAAPSATGEMVTFSSPALRDYVAAQASGDDRVSFALRFTGGCAAGASVVIFEDAESASGTPTLVIFDTNAVEVAAFGVRGQATLTLLVLGLLLAGFVGSRHVSAARA